MKFNFKSFSNAIQHALIDSNDFKRMSLRQLSKEWHISTSTLSRVFNGNSAEIDTVLTICFYLDLTINDYLIY